MVDNAQVQNALTQLSEEEINAVRRILAAKTEDESSSSEDEVAQREKLIEKLLYLPGERRRREFDTLSDAEAPSDDENEQTEEDDRRSDALIRFGDTRKEGSWELSTSGKKIVSTQRLGKYLSKRSYSRLLRRNPEPRGGFLKAQKIDTGFVNTFTKDAEKLDKDIANFQRGFLNCSRPLLALLKLFDTVEEKEVADNFIVKVFADKVKSKVTDALEIINHEAERTRVYRRKALARSAKWPTKLVDSCDTIDNEDQGELFGKDFRDQFHEEAKISKHNTQVATTNNANRGQRGGYSGHRGYTQGHYRGNYGYNNFGRGRGFHQGYTGYQRGFNSGFGRGNTWRPRGSNITRGGQNQNDA